MRFIPTSSPQTPTPDTRGSDATAERAGASTALASKLESALATQDLPTIRSLLRSGADPTSVSTAALRKAHYSGGAAVDGADLIRVARRMQRLTPSDQPARFNGASSAAAAARGSSVLARLRGCFSAPAADEPVQKALRKFNVDTARTVLAATAEPGARYHDQHRDQLIGMLALNDKAKQKDWERKGMLASAKTVINDPSLLAALKAIPYHSDKPGRDPAIDLNGRVQFANSDEAIVCRHLAMHWLKEKAQQSDGKVDYGVLGGPTALQGAVAESMEHEWNVAINADHESHLLDCNRFGEFVHAQFAAMAPECGPVSSRRVLLLTEDHAMAAELKIKRDGDGPPRYVVNFYEPNTTATHRRMRTSDLDTAETLTVDDFINPQRDFRDKFGKDAAILAIIMPAPTAATAEAGGGILPPTAPGKRLRSASAAENTNALHMLARFNYPEDLRAALGKIANKHSADIQATQLAAPAQDGAEPGLHAAMAADYGQVTGIFSQHVLSSESLSSAQKVSLLAAAWNGSTGLEEAILSGSKTAVETFASHVADSDALTQEQKISLLDVRNHLAKVASAMAKNPDTAIENRALGAIIDTIVCANGLTDASKLHLLQPLGDDIAHELIAPL